MARHFLVPLMLLLAASVHAMPPGVSPWASAYAPGRRAVGATPAFTNFIPSKDGPASAGASPQVPPSNPMYPFMTLKPYLPTKPANPFTPSFVPDPQMFVDKKAELLNNLFSPPMMAAAAAAPSGGGGETGGPSKRALGPAGASAWAPGGPAASPWAAAAAAPVDPTVFTDKKADFLSKLFSSLGSVTKPGAGGAPGAGALSIMPPGFWMPLPPTPPTTAAPTPAVPEADDTSVARAKLLTQLLQALATPPTPATPPILLAPPSPSPTAKMMIVPPSYWIPTDPLAGPGTYMKKVSDYLDKLFDSLNTTAASPAAADDMVSARSVAAAAIRKVARHHNDEWRPQDWERALTAVSGGGGADPTSPAAAAGAANPASAAIAAKDLVVSSILSEVGDLKTAMMDTLNEMIIKQKETAAATAATKKPKFGPFAAWGPTPKPTLDPTEPYQKRLETIGQVFDMLTSLGQEVATGASAGAGAGATNATTAAPGGAAARTARSVEEAAFPARSVQMAVHQGYQSFPAGTEEVLSAGAGRDPASTHEGGGLNLKIKVPQ